MVRSQEAEETEELKKNKMTVIGPAEGLNLDAFQTSVDKARAREVRRQVRRAVQGDRSGEVMDAPARRAGRPPLCRPGRCDPLLRAVVPGLRVGRDRHAGAARHRGLIMVEVVARGVFNLGLPWAGELARYAGLGLIFLTVPLLLAQDAHVKVDMFLNLLPAAPRRSVACSTSADDAVLRRCSCLVLVVHAARGALLDAGAGDPQPLVLHAGDRRHGC